MTDQPRIRFRVAIKRVCRCLCSLAGLTLLAAAQADTDCADRCGPTPTTASGYWIWAGLTIPDNLRTNQNLYLYQGLVIGKPAGAQFIRKGLYPHPVDNHSVFLALRLEGELPDAEGLVSLVLTLAENWQKHGVVITGIQLDFDSATAKLLQYSRFLSRIRSWLPERYALSITGLGDWAANGDRRALRAIDSATDEVVFQLYQGRMPLADTQEFVAKLAALDIPFKIGLLDRPDNSKWLKTLSGNRHFQGVVIFLQR